MSDRALSANYYYFSFTYFFSKANNGFAANRKDRL